MFDEESPREMWIHDYEAWRENERREERARFEESE